MTDPTESPTSQKIQKAAEAQLVVETPPRKWVMETPPRKHSHAPYSPWGPRSPEKVEQQQLSKRVPASSADGAEKTIAEQTEASDSKQQVAKLAPADPADGEDKTIEGGGI